MKINQVAQPIISVEVAYLKRNGYLTSNRSELKEELLKKLKRCIKKKYKLLDLTIKNIAQGFIKGLILMLNRLAEDIDFLDKLIKKREVLVIDSVKWLGDSHFNGAAVMLVTLNKVELIYKPHSLICEMIFNKIADKFGGYGYTVIDCQDHGWAECVNIHDHHVNCNDFFYNVGRLQGLAYILMLKDLHYENIKLTNNGYYVLDAECMFSTPVDFKKVGFYNYNNIFDYLIIPVSVNSGEVSLRPMSVLSRYIDNKTITKEKTIILINKFLDGFSFSYSLAMKNKTELINYVHGIFDKVKVRCVLRSTSYYREIIKLLVHPKTLMMNKEKAIELLIDKLSRGGVPIEVVKSEVQSIFNGDIPYFYHKDNIGGISDTYGDSFHLTGENFKKNIVTYFLKNTLSKADMHKQIALIRLFLDSEIQNSLHSGG